MCVFRDTGLNTETQIDFASHLGELDDVSPYVKEGQFYRLPDKRLFDVSNITPDDKVVPANSPQDLWNKVSILPILSRICRLSRLDLRFVRVMNFFMSILALIHDVQGTVF